MRHTFLCTLLVAIATCVLLPATSAATTVPGAPGALDTSFGSAGAATIDWSTLNFDYANAITTQADGAVLVAGTDQSSGELTLMRFTEAGALDTTFGGGDGKADVPDFGGGVVATATAIVVLPNGDIVVAAQRASSALSYLVRFTSTGSAVGTFGAGGISTLAGTIAGTAMNLIDVSALLLAPDGKLVMAGTARINATSQLVAYLRKVDADTGATAGSNYDDFGSDDLSLTGATFSADGTTIVGVGYTWGSVTDSAMFALPYASLGGGLVVPINFATASGSVDRIETITRQGDSYLLGGQRELSLLSPTQAFLAKVQFDGTTITPDATFGTGGVQTFNVNPGYMSVVTAIRTTVEGGLVATARASKSGGTWSAALLKTNANGTPDARVGSGTGVTIFDDARETVGGLTGPRYPFVLDARGRATVTGMYRLAGGEAVHRVWRMWASAADVDVAVTSLDSAAPTVGTPAKFRMTVRNSGTERATGVTVQLGSSAGVSAITAGAPCTAAGSCSIGTLAAGAQTTIDFTVATAAAGALSANANVTTTTADPSAANDTATASVTVAPAPVTTLAATKLSLKQYTKNKARSCGLSPLKKSPCAYSRAYGLLLGGTVSAARAATNDCRVTLVVQRKVRTKWIKVTVPKLATTLCAKSGAWRRPIAKNTMPFGLIRVAASVTASSTAKAATSPWLYLRVTR